MHCGQWKSQVEERYKGSVRLRYGSCPDMDSALYQDLVLPPVFVFHLNATAAELHNPPTPKHFVFYSCFRLVTLPVKLKLSLRKKSQCKQNVLMAGVRATVPSTGVKEKA